MLACKVKVTGFVFVVSILNPAADPGLLVALHHLLDSEIPSDSPGVLHVLANSGENWQNGPPPSFVDLNILFYILDIQFDNQQLRKMGNFSPDEYRHEGNAVSLLNYHFVFIPKRRKKILVGAIAERLQQVICDVCSQNRWNILALEIMPDHVHLFLSAKPVDSPSLIMTRIKGRASHFLRKEFPEVLKLPTLWTPSYFVSTADNICIETVKRYIAQQRE